MTTITRAPNSLASVGALTQMGEIADDAVDALERARASHERESDRGALLKAAALLDGLVRLRLRPISAAEALADSEVGDAVNALGSAASAALTTDSASPDGLEHVLNATRQAADGKLPAEAFTPLANFFSLLSSGLLVASDARLRPHGLTDEQWTTTSGA